MFNSFRSRFASHFPSIPSVAFTQWSRDIYIGTARGSAFLECGGIYGDAASNLLSVAVDTFPANASVSYQWYRLPKGVGDAIRLNGQNSSFFSLSGLDFNSNDGDSYRCVVTLSETGRSFAGPASSIYWCGASPYVDHASYEGGSNARGLFACGINTQNALGDGTTISKTWLNRVAGDKFNAGPDRDAPRIQKVSAGARHGFVLSDKLWGWGNQSSYVGNGGWGSAVASPVEIETSSNGQQLLWKDVAAGGDHTIGIASIFGQGGNHLYGWGLDSSGDGRAPVNNRPELIDFGPWISVAAGGSVGEGHSLALKGSGASGTLWAWGRNNEGQLGLGDNVNRNSPIKVNDYLWKSMAAGWRHTIAIRDDGTLWGWGHNSNGQVGDGTTINKNLPVLIDGGTWTKVSAGSAHSLAIRSDGTLWAWGSRTGDGTMNNSLSPKKISNDSWFEVSAGWLHSAALKYDRTLWTWGNNSAALGNGLLTDDGTQSANSTQVLSPKQVDSGYWWGVSCSVGGDHLLAFR